MRAWLNKFCLKFKQRFCSHFWKDVPDNATESEVMARGIQWMVANVFGNWCECSKCMLRKYISRDEYIQNLMDTGRMRKHKRYE